MPKKDLKRWCLSFYPSNRIYPLFQWLILPILLFSVAAIFSIMVSFRMPKPQPSSVPTQQFSEERARINLFNLTSLGPRVDGTKQQHQTQQWIKERLNGTLIMNSKVEYTEQDFMDEKKGRSMKNIMVRLNPNTGTVDNQSSLLVSCHYDTTDYSFGGSDDGTGIVTMIELINNIAANTNELKYPIIFAFTDGEESGMLGSNALTKHKWVTNVKRFLNLDSVGGPGKSIMFRLYPTSLASEYAKVPYPHSTVIGEEIINHLPSFTDYNDLKGSGLAGFDFVYYYDGYNYHNVLDKPTIVEQGALQHLGDNTMAMITLYQTSNLLDLNITDYSNYIYFDAFGLFLVFYNQRSATIVHSILVSLSVITVLVVLITDHIIFSKTLRNNSIDSNQVFSIYYYFKRSNYHAFITRLLFVIIYFIGFLLSMIAGLLFSLFVSFILSRINPMSWYAQPVLAMLTFLFFCLAGMIVVQFLINILVHDTPNCWCLKFKRRLSKHGISEDGETISEFITYSLDNERYMALLLVWDVLQIAVLASGFRSLYLITIWSVFIVPFIILALLIERSVSWFLLIATNLKRKKQDGSVIDTNNNLLSPQLSDKYKYRGPISVRGPLERDVDTEDTTHLEDEEGTFIAEMEEIHQGVVRKNNRFADSSMYYYMGQEGDNATIRDRIRKIVYLGIRHKLFWLLIPYVATAIPMAFSIDLIVRLLHFIIPTLGRVNPLYISQDSIVAIIVATIASISLLTLLPTLHRSTNFLKLLLAIVVGCIILFIVSCTLPAFSSTAPKRLAAHQIINNQYSTMMGVPLNNQKITQYVAHNSYVYIAALDGYKPENLIRKYVASAYNVSTYVNHIIIDVPAPVDTLHGNSSAYRSISFSNYSSEMIKESTTHNLTITIDHRYVYTMRLTLKAVNTSTMISYFSLNPNDPNINNFYNNGITDGSIASLFKSSLFVDKSIVDISVITSQAEEKVVLDVNLSTCGLNDTPFLEEFEAADPTITYTGMAECATLQENAVITIYLP